MHVFTVFRRLGCGHDDNSFVVFAACHCCQTAQQFWTYTENLHVAPLSNPSMNRCVCCFYYCSQFHAYVCSVSVTEVQLSPSGAAYQPSVDPATVDSTTLGILFVRCWLFVVFGLVSCIVRVCVCCIFASGLCGAYHFDNAPGTPTVVLCLTVGFVCSCCWHGARCFGCQFTHVHRWQSQTSQVNPFRCCLLFGCSFIRSFSTEGSLETL